MQSTHASAVSLSPGLEDGTLGEVGTYGGVVQSVAYWAINNFQWSRDIERVDLEQTLWEHLLEVIDDYRPHFSASGKIVNKKSYVYTCLRNKIRKLHASSRTHSLTEQAVAGNIIHLIENQPDYYGALLGDGGIEAVADKQLWEAFLTGLSLRERAAFYYRLAGYSLEECASILSMLESGDTRQKMDGLRKQEVENGRYIFKGERRKLRVSVKQVRVAHANALRKMKRFAVQHLLTTWLAYLQGAGL